MDQWSLSRDEVLFLMQPIVKIDQKILEKKKLESLKEADLEKFGSAPEPKPHYPSLPVLKKKNSSELLQLIEGGKKSYRESRKPMIRAFLIQLILEQGEITYDKVCDQTDKGLSFDPFGTDFFLIWMDIKIYLGQIPESDRPVLRKN